ncbi:hypothetical protein MUP07_01795, partial [Candidatus Bathyarchaeota archaeon]|nr:hypothetical protein [Candidatus Bathyarchaeota archaeon]
HFALVFRLLRLEHYDMVSRLQLLNEIDYLLVLHPSATSETPLELSVMARQLLRALTMQKTFWLTSTFCTNHTQLLTSMSR